MNNKLILYTNRHKDKIKFQMIGENEVSMSEYFPIGVRCLFKDGDNKEIYAIDPSGGPYIELGGDLNDFYNEDFPMIVTSIRFQDEGIIFTYKKGAIIKRRKRNVLQNKS